MAAVGAAVMQHGKNSSHPGADTLRPLARRSPTICKGRGGPAAGPVRVRNQSPTPCRHPSRCGSTPPAPPRPAGGRRGGSPAGVRWGTCGSITAGRISAAGSNAPTPMAAAVGHSLAAAHDPADGRAPSVHFSSNVDSDNTHEHWHLGGFEANFREPIRRSRKVLAIPPLQR
jgi:hypothetical protein